MIRKACLVSTKDNKLFVYKEKDEEKYGLPNVELPSGRKPVKALSDAVYEQTGSRIVGARFYTTVRYKNRRGNRVEVDVYKGELHPKPRQLNGTEINFIGASDEIPKDRTLRKIYPLVRETDLR